jgi:hypothetical protein
MPTNFWFQPRGDLADSPTDYLPRVGTLDDRLGTGVQEQDVDAEVEQAAATQAIRRSMRPDRALLQRILDGLRER